jgi:hypothetical protein
MQHSMNKRRNPRVRIMVNAGLDASDVREVLAVTGRR